MSNPIQINNDDEETVEIPLTEYKAVMEFSVAISEQNSTIMDAIRALITAQQVQAENLTATFAALRDAIANVQIVVNVPEQPAPVVSVSVPEQLPAQVTVKTPPEKERTATVKFGRNSNGALTTADIKIK
jgi:hypothetical protein